jgi:hypothetical protein
LCRVDKRQTFTDDAKKLAKTVPGMGFYKLAETGHHKVKPSYRTAYMGKQPDKSKGW